MMKKQIYAVLGDYYHEHDPLLKSLKDAVRPFENQVEIHDIAAADLPTALSKSPDLLILDKENRVNPEDDAVRLWMTPETEQQIVEYVSRGGSFFAWHTGLSSYPIKGELVKMLRGSFRFHPSVNKPVTYSSRQNRFFDVGPARFEVMDEHYFVECDLANTNVFLYSESADGASVAGWSHEFGKGRVCCITPTHRAEGLTSPDFLALLGKTVRWSLKL